MADATPAPNVKSTFNKAASVAGKVAKGLGFSFLIATVTATTMGGGLAAAATLTTASGPFDVITSMYSEAGSEVLGMFSDSKPDLSDLLPTDYS